MDVFTFKRDTRNIACLFPEILTIIFKSLDVHSKGRAAQVCSKWRDSAYDKSVWRGVEAKLDLRRWSNTLLNSLIRRGIVRLRILYVKHNLNEVITGLHELQSLNLRGCTSCTDQQLLCLSKPLPLLTVLDLSFCKKITDHSIGIISNNLPNIQSLDIAGCHNVTAVGLTWIAWGLRQLQCLNLRSCRLVSDRAIGNICGQNVKVCGADGNLQLRTFILQDCQNLTDQALKYIANGLHHLNSLNLSFCSGVTNNGLRYLSRIQSLQALHLSGCAGFCDGGVAYLCQGSAHISRLDVSFCPGVSNTSLIHMSQGMYHLQHLSMRSCDIADDGLGKLIRFAPELTTLSVGQCDKLTDISLYLIVKHLKRLQCIDLYGCHKITAAGLDILKQLPRLSSLNQDLWQHSVNYT